MVCPPPSEATVGGAVMITGATIAGSVAPTRTVSPSRVGLRGGPRRRYRGPRVGPIGGDDGGLPGIQVRVLRFFRAIVCIASAFGCVFGRIAG